MVEKKPLKLCRGPSIHVQIGFNPFSVSRKGFFFFFRYSNMVLLLNLCAIVLAIWNFRLTKKTLCIVQDCSRNISICPFFFQHEGWNVRSLPTDTTDEQWWQQTIWPSWPGVCNASTFFCKIHYWEIHWAPNAYSQK